MGGVVQNRHSRQMRACPPAECAPGRPCPPLSARQVADQYYPVAEDLGDDSFTLVWGLRELSGRQVEHVAIVAQAVVNRLDKVGASIPILVRDDGEVDVTVTARLATGDRPEDHDGVGAGHRCCDDLLQHLDGAADFAQVWDRLGAAR